MAEGLVKIKIRPQSGSWVMGEDWEVELPETITIGGLKKYIEKVKLISCHRQQIRQENLKLITPAKEIYTLKRLGTVDGTVYYVEPTQPLAWLWNSREYYNEKLLSEVTQIIENNGGSVSAKDLSALIQCPPCFNYSIVVFLRQFPDRIFILSDITTGNKLISLAPKLPKMFLPRFDNVPVSLGKIDPNKHYSLVNKFDWEEHAEFDDLHGVQAISKPSDIMTKFAATLLGDDKSILSMGSLSVSTNQKTVDKIEIVTEEPNISSKVPLVGSSVKSPLSPPQLDVEGSYIPDTDILSSSPGKMKPTSSTNLLQTTTPGASGKNQAATPSLSGKIAVATAGTSGKVLPSTPGTSGKVLPNPASSEKLVTLPSSPGKTLSAFDEDFQPEKESADV